ncbi:hypothetical protein [Salinibacter sp. 10B]|uniref:hypothetical protein n=1 Tax=Salinibacter sp. 10B TaxID=1923971 RepID=UPI00215812A7|nr:hypothetical protein [Salinibacter sp. 10B]
MVTFFRHSNQIFDAFESWWEGKEARRIVGYALVGGFFIALLVIEAKRLDVLPASIAASVSSNHFVAIDVAFTLFLVVEIIGLVVGLATSVADTAGKQFEVFSLILLRRSFKELVKFNEEPIEWSFEAGREAVQLVVVDAVGALLIFLTLGLFYTLQQHEPLTQDEVERWYFVAQKKLVSNVLLFVLGGLGVYTCLSALLTGEEVPFFNAFYTVLIFSDILIVLISLRYSSTYHMVFRNSGYAAATVMIRLALAGPEYLGTALGVVASLFNVGVAAAYRYVAPAAQASAQRSQERKAFEQSSGEMPPEEPGELPS